MEPIVIESWVHEVIRKKFGEDIEFRRWLGMESLPEINRETIDRYHLYLFKKTLSYAAVKSVFYRDLLKNAGIKPDDIRTMKDIARIPFTEPDDIARQPYTFACVPLGEVTSITTFASSGTTGPQKKVFVSDADLGRMTDFMAAGMKTVAKAGDTVQIMLPSRRPNDQSALLAIGVRKMGGKPVVAGNTLSSEEQVRYIDENHPSVLFGETAYLWRVTQEMRHLHDLKTRGVKIIFLTAEHCSRSMRRQLEEIWGCTVHVHYGMTEMGLGVSIECGAHDGYHFNEADLMVEIIDPETGEVLGDDMEGEVVFSALNREAMPLLRFRTHDISRLIGAPCRCTAYTMKKIAPVDRRREAIVKTSAGELYPSIFDEMLFSLPDIIDYQLTVSRSGDNDILSFKIETNQEDNSTKETIYKTLQNHPVIRRGLQLSPIEFVSRGALTRMSRAKKLILDMRHQPGV